MSDFNKLTYDRGQLDSLLASALDVDDGTIVVNEKGIITFINTAFAGVFKRRPSEMLGRHVLDAYINSEPSRLPVTLATGEPEIGNVHLLNGRYMVVNRCPVYDKGKIVGGLGKLVYNDLQQFKKIYSKVNNHPGVVSGPAHPSVKYDLNSITGRSPQILRLKECIKRVAVHNSTVLIRGECGTGKELVAQAIHDASLRRANLFVKLNCAAIPEHLLESELFGYEEGAFTGARKGGKKGKFELAHRGTIFLDEIGEMSFGMQAKLLRVLQEMEIEPLGGQHTKSVDVRVVAATNANLEELVSQGKFREDLYFRLKVVSLTIPPLRERKEDIKLLVEHFVKKYNDFFSLNIEKVSPEVIDYFAGYYWPGNVRELENVLEAAFNFVEGNVLTFDKIAELCPQMIDIEYGEEKAAESIVNKHSLDKMKESAEKKMILQALAECNGNKAKAAQVLGFSRPGLYKKLVKYNINL